jgi:hypothetical protein
MSPAHFEADMLPQLTAILLIFRAKGIPTDLTSRSIALSVTDCSFSTMAVTTLASFWLRMLSTYLTVRSIMPRSTRLSALNHVPRLRAIFLNSQSFLAEKSALDLELEEAATLDSHSSLPIMHVDLPLDSVDTPLLLLNPQNDNLSGAIKGLL